MTRRFTGRWWTIFWTNPRPELFGKVHARSKALFIPQTFMGTPRTRACSLRLATNFGLFIEQKILRRPVTDTPATKILMGALGGTPAYDQYVVKSIKKYGLYDTKMSVITSLVIDEN